MRRSLFLTFIAIGLSCLIKLSNSVPFETTENHFLIEDDSKNQEGITALASRRNRPSQDLSNVDIDLLLENIPSDLEEVSDDVLTVNRRNRLMNRRRNQVVDDNEIEQLDDEIDNENDLDNRRRRRIRNRLMNRRRNQVVDDDEIDQLDDEMNLDPSMIRRRTIEVVDYDKILDKEDFQRRRSGKPLLRRLMNNRLNDIDKEEIFNNLDFVTALSGRKRKNRVELIPDQIELALENISTDLEEIDDGDNSRLRERGLRRRNRLRNRNNENDDDNESEIESDNDNEVERVRERVNRRRDRRRNENNEDENENDNEVERGNRRRNRRRNPEEDEDEDENENDNEVERGNRRRNRRRNPEEDEEDEDNGRNRMSRRRERMSRRRERMSRRRERLQRRRERMERGRNEESNENDEFSRLRRRRGRRLGRGTFFPPMFGGLGTFGGLGLGLDYLG